MTLLRNAVRAAILALAIWTAPATAREAQPGLYVRMGEIWMFRIADGQPVDARQVLPDEEPGEGEVRVTLREGMGGTMMVVSNGGPQSWNYQAWIARNSTSRGQRTSVCTLLPGVGSFESWPGALPGIRLTAFEPGGEGMTCR